MKKILALCCMLALLAGLLCGCGTKGAEDALIQYLEAVAALDYDGANALVMVDSSNEGKVDPVLTKSAFNDALLSSLSYDIWDSEKKSGEQVVFTVMLHQISMKQVYSDVIPQYSTYILEQSKEGKDPSQEEIEALLEEYMLTAVEKNKTVKTTTTVSIEMRKTDGGWRVVADKALLNGIFGGLVEAMEELIDTESSTD